MGGSGTFWDSSFLVSIQLLLLFYSDLHKGSDDVYKVSIQLLLLFYSLEALQEGKHSRVSIQLLLLFYHIEFPSIPQIVPFQYNSCYCSILSTLEQAIVKLLFQYNSCYCSMIWLRIYNSNFPRFQYNSCYCSIQEGGKDYLIFYCFNTTLVTVLWAENRNFSFCRDCFNTTLVTVLFDGSKLPFGNKQPVSIQLLLLFYA